MGHIGLLLIRMSIYDDFSGHGLEVLYIYVVSVKLINFGIP